MPHPGGIVQGRRDLFKEPSEKHKWWECRDPTFPIHIEHDHDAKMGADEHGNVKLAGYPVQKEWSGSWREYMAEVPQHYPTLAVANDFVLVGD